VWDLKMPPSEALRKEQRLSARVIERTAERLVVHFNADRIASGIVAALHDLELVQLRVVLTDAHRTSAEVLSTLHLSVVPKRAEIDALAKTMYSKARALDEVVDRAYELLLTAVGARLALQTELPI
jgi:stearoyl-CoA desaturase (delta-9 desaturase)